MSYLNNKINLTGRKALVTGVSRTNGIGFTICKHLLEAGADVFLQSWTKHDEMQDWGEPDDVARLVTWLASDDARWITGQVLNSNGGGY